MEKGLGCKMGILDGWRYCPCCAAALRVTPAEVQCTECGYRFWANPVPGSQALVERDGRILLGRRRNDPSAGLWDLPGGFLNEDEHPMAALRREIREETSFEIEPIEFLGIWMQRYGVRQVLCLTWLVEPTYGVERAGDDLIELRWFGPDELPSAEELAFETYVDILSLWHDRQGHA